MKTEYKMSEKNQTDKMNKEEKESENTQSKNSESVEKQEDVKKALSSDEILAQEKDKFLRLFAEFENYKKRTSKERLELFKTANRELMTVLLPVLDDFGRGLSEIKEKDNELYKGMQLISDKFRKTLEQKGLSLMKIKKGEKFDPDVHQAITQIPAPSKKLKGKIIDITEQGYMLGDVIIRYPKVVVGN